MTDEEIAVKMSEMDHRARSNTRRIEKLELQTEALEKLATSVELLVAEQKHQTAAMMDIKTDVEKLDKKVETLEHKPGKRWENIVEKIIFSIIGGVVGFILVKLGIN